MPRVNSENYLNRNRQGGKNITIGSRTGEGDSQTCRPSTFLAGKALRGLGKKHQPREGSFCRHTPNKGRLQARTAPELAPSRGRGHLWGAAPRRLRGTAPKAAGGPPRYASVPPRLGGGRDRGWGRGWGRVAEALSGRAGRGGRRQPCGAAG